MLIEINMRPWVQPMGQDRRVAVKGASEMAFIEKALTKKGAKS